jgi:hypothetical protein
MSVISLRTVYVERVSRPCEVHNGTRVIALCQENTRAAQNIPASLLSDGKINGTCPAMKYWFCVW